MGHFIPARKFGIRVEKFYLFFDTMFFVPGLNRLKFSLFKKKVGDTEYGLGWFPFGGYVNIVGMFGKPEEPEEIAAEEGVPEDQKFRNKKPWQRMIVLAGGITVNLILGYLLYVMILNVWGETVLPVENNTYGMACDSLARVSGLQDGDKLLTVDGKKPQSLQEARTWILLDNAEKLVVDRDGQQVSVTLPEDIEYTMIKVGMMLFSERIPFYIDSVAPNSMAGYAHFFKKGDQVIRVNGESTPYFQDFKEKINKLANKSANIVVLRDGKPDSISIYVNESKTIGVVSRGLDQLLKMDTLHYSFGASFGRAYHKTFDRLVNYIKQFKLVFTKAGAKQIGGIAAIGSLFPKEWDWEAFWNLTATLSIILAFMNLLPIPVFDGGYMLFTLWEMVTGRPVPDKVLKRSLNVGMWIVLALFLYSNGNDLYRMVLSKYF